MRKKRFIYTLAAVLLMCSAAGVGAGCGKSSPALLDSFGTHLDTLMTSKDKLSKMDGAAADLCVIENEDGFSENDRAQYYEGFEGNGEGAGYRL